jgi:hypothetical protein
LPELLATVKPAGFPPRPDDERIWPSDGPQPISTLR